MTGIISVQTLSAPTSMPTSGLTSYAPSTIPSLSPLSAAPTAEFLTTSPTGGPVSSIPTGMPTQTISQNPTILASTNKPTTVSLDSNQPTINPMYGNKTLEWSMGSGAYDNVFISVGDTVRWIWMDSLPHNVYSTDNGFESSPTINEQGYIYKVTFCIPGSYPFKCTIHPLQMMGVVVVSANIGDKINENGNGWTKSNTILLATLLTILVLFHVVCTLVYLSRESSVCLSMLYINPPQPPEMDCNNIIDLYKNG